MEWKSDWLLVPQPLPSVVNSYHLMLAVLWPQDGYKIMHILLPTVCRGLGPKRASFLLTLFPYIL